MVSFRLFDLQETEFCNGDYLEVRVNDGGGELLGHFCGSNTLPGNITASNRLWIKFRSDADTTASGFIADYSLGKDTEEMEFCFIPQFPLFSRFSSWERIDRCPWRDCFSPFPGSLYPSGRFHVAGDGRHGPLCPDFLLPSVLH